MNYHLGTAAVSLRNWESPVLKTLERDQYTNDFKIFKTGFIFYVFQLIHTKKFSRSSSVSTLKPPNRIKLS